MSLSALVENFSVPITRMGVNKRFDEHAYNFLEGVYSHMFTVMSKSCEKSLSVEVLKRFKGIKISDSTSWKVPAALKENFPGSNHAGCKVQFMLDYKTGTLEHAAIGGETGSDQQYSKNMADRLEKNDLSLSDLGYMIPESMYKIDAKGAFFISRYNDTAINIYMNDDPSCDDIDILTLLGQLHHQQAVYDIPCYVGKRTQKTKARLLAVRAPEEVANRRRQKLHIQSQKKGRTLKERTLKLCDWTFLITNIPSEKGLTIQEIFALYSIRWTIELFFKQLKSVLNIHKTFVKSNPCRLKAEILARIIVALFITYCFSISRSRSYLWCQARRELSFEKTVKFFKYHATVLLGKFLDSLHRASIYLQQMIAKIIASCDKFRQATRKNSLDKLIEQTLFAKFKHIKITPAKLVELMA